MTNDGGPARDMTLRDHFAGLAMQGIISAFKKSYTDSDDGVKVGFFNTEATSKDWLADCAADAYTIADAMLNERARNG